MNKPLLAAALAISSLVASAQTKIIAHRGFSGIAPENTLIAFQKAIECGADYFELDVRKTMDDSIVVIHDATVDRTSSNNARGNIAEMTYHELTAVKAGYKGKFSDKYKDEKVPTLREALTLARGKIKVCIEIKVPGVEREVIKIVDDLGMHDEVIIFSFDNPVLVKIRQLDQNIPILYLVEKAEELTLDYARVIGSAAIGVGDGTMVTGEYLDAAHHDGIEVWIWTVDDEDEMQRLIDIGIDGLITNFPDKALKKLDRNGP